MATGQAMNRTYVDLPQEVSQDILQKTQEESIIMQLAERVALPGNGLQIPMITGDPEPSWVSETASKQVAFPTFDKKVMQGHKLAVIIPFSNEFRRDVAALYDAVRARLPRVFAKKFDKTCFFGPDSGTLANFDNLAGVTAQALDSSSGTAYNALVAADIDISEQGGTVNGYAFSPQGRGILLNAEDSTHRPLFVNGVADGSVPRILGAPTYFSAAAYKAGTTASTAMDPDIVGFAGDWTHAKYGIVEAFTIDISEEATLTYTDAGDNSVTINLWQQNMFALRAEFEVGFVAESAYFNALTRSHA